MKLLRKILCGGMALFLLLLSAGCGQKEPEKETPYTIVTTMFSAYDFARQVAGDTAKVQLLLPPGTESHSYEPTPSDMIAVQNADVFFYLGGESDTWVETILDAVDRKGIDLKMTDYVELLEEETVEGMQEAPGHDSEEHEHTNGGHGEGEVVDLDEHVWTSPKNAMEIVKHLRDDLVQDRPEEKDILEGNAEAYLLKLQALDQDMEELFAKQDPPKMVFGDRFPLRYFAEAYGIQYSAAFPGCGAQTEPSAATVAFLVEKVKEEGISTIWYIEFSNHLVADAIAEAAGVQTAMFHCCHNISPEDLQNGETYVTLMQGNLERLKQSFT